MQGSGRLRLQRGPETLGHGDRPLPFCGEQHAPPRLPAGIRGHQAQAGPGHSHPLPPRVSDMPGPLDPLFPCWRRQFPAYAGMKSDVIPSLQRL